MVIQEWFLQVKGDVLGPLSHAELCDLARRGGLQSQTPVSADRATWMRADSIAGLDFSNATTPPTGESQASSKLTLAPLLVILLVGGSIAACGGVLLIAIALSGATGTPEDFSGGYAYQESLSSREQIIAEGTFAYWHALGQVLEQSKAAYDSQPDAAVTIWRRATTDLRSLPTHNVDQDAVTCGLDIATVLSNLADFVEQSNSPALLVQSFLRGAAGDPFGTTADLLDAESTLHKQVQYVDEQLQRTRGILSSRYGIEFPAL